MKIKKLILMGMLFGLISGCAQQKQEEKVYYFLFATPLSEHTIWLQAKEGFDDACEDYQVKGDWIGPAIIDTDEMEKVISTGILQQADGIITQGVISAELVEKATEKGIPIIFVDSDVEETSRFAYMGKDFNEQAQLLLDDIEKQLGEDEPLKIAIQAANLDFKIARDQIDEIRKVFKQHAGGFEIVSISQSLSDDIRSKKEWEGIMSQHQDINVTINFAAESAQFCYEAVEQYDRKEQILIYGVDDMPATLQLIREGKIDGSVVTSFYQYGYKSVEMLVDYAKNGQIAIDPKTNLIIVNKENVENYREINDEK